MNRFVIQEHQATHLHWDFRLEKDGVLKSWAVPKSPPEQKGIKRLAVQVQDHEVSYIDFQGTIPEGQYGAGTVKIWDKGTYQIKSESPKDAKGRLASKRPKRIVFELKGKRLKGRYALIHLKEKQWLLMKL